MSNIYDILPTLGPMNRILDIGCSRMVDTVKLRAMFPSAEIYAFDPDPRTVSWIRETLIDKGYNITFYPIALSDRDGLADFYLSTTYADVAQHTDSSSLRRPVSFSGTAARPSLHFNPDPIWIDAMRLDSLSLAPVDFIWMDAQGAEDMIIRGGQETLVRTRYLYTEHNTDGDYHDASNLERIKSLLPGWTVEHLWKDDVLLKNPSSDKS